MKIVLTTLPREGEFVNWTTSTRLAPIDVKYIPLGILSLASNLSKEHEVILLDPASNNLSINELAQQIQLLNPDVLGISVVTRRVYALYELLKKIKVKYIAAGGPHCTYYANDLLTQGVDVVFIGNLADQEFQTAMNLKELPKGVIRCNSDINIINFPNRELIDINKYMFHGKVLFMADNRMSMFSSIGCPHQCTFCNVQSKKVCYKNSELVVKEMQYLQSIGCESVHILDDNFNINRKHLSGILNELEKKNWVGEWSGRGQVNMDLSLVSRMAETGFKRIHVGFEVLDDKILKWYQKPQNVAQISRFCESMGKHNIDILGYFIIGSPLETTEYLKSLPSQIRSLGIKYPFFNVLYPEPNTRYYSMLLQSGIYKIDYWKKFMKTPTPEFEIPYPYGKAQKHKIFNKVNELINEFKKHDENI